jgi:hypothetical protein
VCDSSVGVSVTPIMIFGKCNHCGHLEQSENNLG